MLMGASAWGGEMLSEGKGGCWRPLQHSREMNSPGGIKHVVKREINQQEGWPKGARHLSIPSPRGRFLGQVLVRSFIESQIVSSWKGPTRISNSLLLTGIPRTKQRIKGIVQVLLELWQLCHDHLFPWGTCSRDQPPHGERTFPSAPT